MKIITLCGSLKFQKEMMEIAEKVETFLLNAKKLFLN